VAAVVAVAAAEAAAVDAGAADPVTRPNPRIGWASPTKVRMWLAQYADPADVRQIASTMGSTILYGELK